MLLQGLLSESFLDFILSCIFVNPDQSVELGIIYFFFLASTGMMTMVVTLESA
jgi:hypothetical protein